MRGRGVGGGGYSTFVCGSWSTIDHEWTFILSERFPMAKCGEGEGARHRHLTPWSRVHWYTTETLTILWRERIGCNLQRTKTSRLQSAKEILILRSTT